METVKELTNGEFDRFIKEGLVLVDFSADWCMPCLMMTPILEEIGEKLAGKIKFGKVDVGENQDIASKFGVSSIPNFVLFKDGEVADQFTGSMPAEAFEEKLNKFL